MLPFAPILIAQFGFSPVERITPAPIVAPVSCEKAANPAIETASATKVTLYRGVATYVIHLTILNRGSRAQPADLKANVIISQNGEKLEAQSVPPLDPGVAFAYQTKFKRSADAGSGSSTLVFKYSLDGRPVPSIDDCKAVDDIFALTF